MGVAAVAIFTGVLLLTGVTPERWVDTPGPKSENWRWRLSVAAADTAVALLAATLLAGPLRVWRGGRPAVHRPWRRVLGVWAGLFALAHAAVAVWVHVDWPRVWANWVNLSPFWINSGPRGVANWLGLVQVALIGLLLWLSRDAALRRLGGATWKRLQRSAYLLGALVVAHTLLYHRVEQRIAAHRIPILTLFALALGGQLAGLVVVLRRRRAAAADL